MTLKFTPVYLLVLTTAWVSSGCESQYHVDFPLLSTVEVTKAPYDNFIGPFYDLGNYGY